MDADRAPRETRPGGAHPAAQSPAAPDLDELQRQVAEALGPPGALLALRFSAYRRAHPAHLAIKNAGVLLGATDTELWYGDLDLTRRADALCAAAAAIGQPLLVVHESDRPAWAIERGRRARADAPVRARPDGRLEVDPRAGYRRGTRLYRQTAAGYARWERHARRRDPASLSPRERARLLRQLAELGPADLPGTLTEARLALVLDVEDDAVVLRVPALGFRGSGEDIESALADLANGLTAAAPGRLAVARRSAEVGAARGPATTRTRHAAQRPDGHPRRERGFDGCGPDGRERPPAGRCGEGG